MKNYPRFVLGMKCLVLLFLFTCTTGSAKEELDEVSAKARLLKLSQDIQKLQAQLTTKRDERQQEQNRLREIDFSIQESSLLLRELDAQRLVHQQELNELSQQKQQFLVGLELREDQLVTQIQASYRISKQSRLQLVLNQDNPDQLSRTLAYYDYVNRAQVRDINELKSVLAELERMQDSIDQELVRLTEVEEEQKQTLFALQSRRSERQTLLAAILGQIDNDEIRLGELIRNRQDLESLLARLENALADIPADLGKRLGVAAQKGKLNMPVKGSISHAFGQRRSGGMRWQGWMIRSDPGTDVRPVAYGRVAYADWLRGYGLLMIIDHGSGFMSLYGNNESLFKEVGDWVEPTESIAQVGQSSTGDQAMYFELRKDGKALDPAAWLRR